MTNGPALGLSHHLTAANLYRMLVSIISPWLNCQVKEPYQGQITQLNQVAEEQTGVVMPCYATFQIGIGIWKSEVKKNRVLI
jgi:hypothetical protein